MNTNSKNDNKTNNASIHAGHRQRVFNKYKEYGLDSFAEHEVLEMLLFYTIPRADTNPLAHKLISKFGSLKGVFLATPDELMTVDGVGEKTALMLPLFREVRKYENTHLFNRNIYFDSIDRVGLFCIQYFADHINEEAIMLSLDGRNHLKKLSVLSKGTFDETGFYPNEIMKTALNLRAASIVIAHNHPAGYLNPSPSDIILTKELENTLKGVRIKLIDHILCGRLHFCSFRERGILDRKDIEDKEE